jgi:hypothetical protein
MFVGQEVAQISQKHFPSKHPSHIEPPVKAKDNKKVNPTKKKQVLGSKNVTTINVPLDSPSMGTRSEKNTII